MLATLRSALVRSVTVGVTGLVLVLAFAASTPVLAADVVWRMATKQPPDSNEGKSFQRFADKVKEHSGGRMEVRVYPNEQLGKTEAVLEQIQAGTVHLYPEGSAYLSKWVEDIKFSSAPFMFENR